MPTASTDRRTAGPCWPSPGGGERVIVVGNRQGMAGENVPWTSRFGRGFSNFWVWAAGGPWIADSQSGFRLYPLPEALQLGVRARRYQFEVEILVRARRSGIATVEVPVSVVYQPKGVRVSHFRPWRDFLPQLRHLLPADLRPSFPAGVAGDEHRLLRHCWCGLREPARALALCRRLPDASPPAIFSSPPGSRKAAVCTPSSFRSGAGCYHLWCTFRQYQNFTTIHFDRFLAQPGTSSRSSPRQGREAAGGAASAGRAPSSSCPTSATGRWPPGC